MTKRRRRRPRKQPQKKPRAARSTRGARTAQKRQRSATPARAITKRQPPEGIVALNNAQVALPLEWFISPLRLALCKAIRPPTARTRRKQRIVELPLPMLAFTHLLRNFSTGELQDLEWLDDEKTSLKPTQVKPTYREYNYKLTRPAQLNKLWEMQLWDPQYPGTKWHQAEQVWKAMGGLFFTSCASCRAACACCVLVRHVRAACAACACCACCVLRAACCVLRAACCVLCMLRAACACCVCACACVCECRRVRGRESEGEGEGEAR